MRTMTRCLTVCVTLVAFAAGAARNVVLDFSAANAPKARLAAVSSVRADESVVDTWNLTLGNPEALDTLAVGDTLTFSLAETDTDFSLVLTATAGAGELKGWRAAIDGVECAAVFKGTQGWFIDITDFTSGFVYRLRQKEGANWTATKHDPNLKPITYGEMPSSAPPVIPESRKSVLQASVAATASSDFRYIDVLFAFDAGGQEIVAENNQTLLEYSLAQLAKMNGVLANSKLADKMQFRFAGTVTVSTRVALDGSGSETFNALKEALGGVVSDLDAWHAINVARERYGADLISVSVDTGSAYGTVGLGGGLPSIDDARWYDNSCYVHAISAQAAYVHNVEIHETGHNMGAGHSNLQEATGQSSDYSFGYYFNGAVGSTVYYTIMAYNVHPVTGAYCIECPQFSSPDLTYTQAQIPAGTPTNDNRRVLMETYQDVALWRTENQAMVSNDFFGVGGEYANGVVATFKGFDTLKSGDYSLDVGGNLLTNGKITLYDDALKITGGRTWSGLTNGISVLVKYSELGIPMENKALIAFRNTAASTANDNGVGVFVKSGDGTVHGIWQGKTWTGNDSDSGKVQVCNKKPAASGYMVFSYTTARTLLYDGSGSKLYESSGLKSSNSQDIGDVVSVGGLSGDTMVFGGLEIEGIRIYKGALASTEIAAAVADFEAYEEKEPTEELSPMYVNRLSTGEEVVPAGKYGAITVPENGFKATAFDTETNLSNTESDGEIVGSYTNIIKNGTYVNTHTVAGWFNVGALPTDSALKVVYIAQAVKYDGALVNDNHCGYKVAVDKDGKLYVGKVKYSSGTWNWQDGAYKTTSASAVSGSSWFHLAVAATAVTSTNPKSVLPVIYVNGQTVELDLGSFAGNLNGNKCGRFWIGADVTASGIYVDTAALTTTAAVVSAALSTPVGADAPPVVIPEKDFTYKPKANASPSGWIAGFESNNEPFTTSGEFRLGPDGACVSAVSSGHHPWSNLAGKSNYTMALYADISQMAHDTTGRYMLTMGGKNNGVNQGLLMTQDGNVQLYQANGSTVQQTLDTTMAPAAGYHLFVWTQSTSAGGTLYVDGVKVGSLSAMTSATSTGFQIGSLHGGVWNSNYSQGIGMAVAGVYGWGQVLTDEQVALLAEQYPATSEGVAATSVPTGISGTLNLINGDTIPSGDYGCTVALGAGAHVNITHEGEVKNGMVILSAQALTIPAGAVVTINGKPYVYKADATSITVFTAVAEVGGMEYATMIDAAKAAGDGGVMTLLKPYDELEDQIRAAAITLTAGEGANVYTNNFNWAVGSALIVTEIMPKPTDKPDEIVGQAGYDKNGLESGWVELLNTTNAWVNLKDYKFIRVNRSKANSKGDYGNFPFGLIGPGERTVFYTSERYANSVSPADSAFATPVDEGKPHFFEEYNMMIWPDKVNPKKFAFVRFSYNPAGGDEEIIDTVVIPSDIPEGYSIIVEPFAENEATVRYLCAAPTMGTENPPVDGLEKLGPNVGPLYEITGGKKHDSVSEFGVVVPAKTTEDYTIAFALNPTMHPTEKQTDSGNFRAADVLESIKIVYRTNLDDTTLATNDVDMTAGHKWDEKDQGHTYTATIPNAAFANLGAGRVIQWKFLIADAAGNEWTSPSFHNPDDGYEWYGTITEPCDLNSAKLPTWHMFVDSASLAQMDKDADEQSLPNKARAAIYDASTSNYYDYVRIDLRGNTSASFSKKSHGLRFAKSHPLTMRNSVTGKDIEEIRKTSLISEVGDPTYLRQLTAFWLLNKVGSPAPFDFPVRVNLNGSFYQLAFNSERFTDELIEDVYGLDKYGYAYKNVGTLKSGSGTTAGGIEKKTPDDGNESDISVLQNELRAKIKAAQQVKGTDEAARSGTDTTGLENAALTKFVVEKFNLPAWLNYLAITRLTQECDDVWANISAYYDNAEMKEGTRGTGTWMPLAYDMNLSFGQWHAGDLGKKLGLMSTNDWFKSHPFYGGNRVRCWKSADYATTCGSGNDGFESVWQNAKFRRLYLRRLRTLMDQELKAPGAPEEDVPFMVEMRKIAALFAEEAVADRAKYPAASASIGAINVWPTFPASVDAGLEDIWNNYVVPRRQHLYVTHAAAGHAESEIGYASLLCAGIPAEQSPIAELKGGFTASFDEASGLVTISNANDEAVDLSNWELSGPMAMTLPAGTVVDANDAVYVVADRRAYVAANDASLTDQVIVGNATLGSDPTSPIILKTENGTSVIAPVVKSDQEQYLRLWGFCGVPQVGDDDAGEFMIFTNLNLTAELDASGADIQFEKVGESEGRCHFALPARTVIQPGGWVRFDRNDIPWNKITNGNLDIVFKASNGAIVYSVSGLSQELLGVKNTGYFAVYDFEKEEWTKKPIAEAPLKPAPPAVDVVLTGAYPDGTNIVLTADTTVVVSNAAFGAKLAFTSNFVATVRLPADTSSTAKSIMSEGRLILEGEGALSVSNNTTLVTCGGLTIEGGTLDLELNDDSGKTMVAAEMLGSYIQNGGAVNLRMLCTGGAEKEKSAYGFRWKDRPNGVAELNGGTFATTMHSDYQSVAFKANDVSNTVLFGGAEVTGEFTGVDGRLASTDGEIAVKSGAKVVVNSTATGSRVFKSDTSIRLRKAKVTVHALGAGSEIFSCDDTIDAGHDSMVLVLESTDDCFSAQTNIIVSAGVVYGVSTENDVLDSNGQMTISGGTVLAYALTPGHEGIDTECYPDNGLDHTLTISGGTVVALGGTGSAWPTNVVFTQRVYTNLSCSATAFSEKYLALDGEFAKTTVKLPTIADDFILLATAPALTADPTVGEDAPSDEPIAANVPAWVETKSPQQFVRFYAIYGNTTEGSEEAGTLGDVGEYLVLTNLSAELTVDLTGLTVNVEKLDDWTKKGESGSKCLFTLTGGTIPPGGSVRLDQASYWGGAKQKITNGDLYIALTDSTGAAVQKGYASNDLYPECDGNGAALVAKTFGKTMAMTTADWKPSFAWFVFTVGESGAMITGLGETLADEATLTLPTELGKAPVVAIADSAFANCANLRHLVFKGTPPACSSAAFPVGVIGSYDAAQAGWDEAIVDGRWNGLVMLNGSEETISVNIAAGYPVSGTEKHGLFGVKGDQWLNVVGTWGSETAKTIDAGAVTAVVEGVSVARTNVVIQTAARNTYKYDAASQETFFKGYLDDGGNRARITVANVPYSKYDVIVYATSDQEGRALSPVTVNGVAYTWSGETTVGSSTWGATRALYPQLGQNVLWIPNQTALTLAIVGGPNANSARGGIAAIQIVNRGEVDEEPGKDFAGYMDQDATLETVDWTGGPFEAGRKNTATILVAGEDELRLTLSDPLVELKSLVLAGDADLWLEASEYPKNIATLDLTGVNGRVTYGWPVYTLESSSANVAYAGGAGTAKSPVLLNPKGGRLWLRGGMYYIANNSWSGTSTTVDIDDSTLDFGDGIFGVGTAAYTIGGASEVTAASFVLSQGGNSRTSVFTLKDEAVLNVTGETIIDKNTSSIMFGHWNGPSTFTITNNAVFNAPKAEVLVGKTGNAQTINVAGGVFEAYGIKASANATGDNRLNLSGGELKLGTGGISTYKAGRTIAISVTDGAQITATSDMTIDQPITVAEGVTLALGSENGATFTVGADTFAEASAGRIEVTKGNVKLSGEGVLGTQKLKVNEGATVTLALADFGEITEEGVVPFDVESGDTETFSRVVISDGAQHPYVKFDTDPVSPTFGRLLYTAPRCELTGLHIAEICGKPTEKDPNGRESGWVELVNYGPESVNLRDYKLYRLNYGKKDKSADAQKMLDRVVRPGGRTLVYMSEDYETAEDYGGDGVTIRNFGDIMVIPTKINPKKYPCVTLYDADDKVIDKVVVPCELDDNGSVLVGVTTNRTERFVTFTPTPLAEKDFATALAIGPEVNGLYGKKDYANDLQSLNRHDGFAPAGVGFKVRLPINPVCESTLKADKIKSVRLIYRVFDPAGSEVKSVALTSSKPTADEESRWGKKSGVWEGEIPADDMIAGKLVQYAAMITDGSGTEWRAPRFVYPELGYEWYGVVVDPGEAVRTDKLQTFLFFIDNVNKAQMDTDADSQTLPYCARTAVYDTQTHTYYDNVRIDLRGNTSKGFTKKSHGLRFNKVAPLVCTDPTTGEELEVRKTSFISEFADPTYMRQMLSFWMLRDAGCTVPFDYPARLYLNGEYYQLAFHSVRFSDDMIENVYGLNKHVYSYKNIGTFGGSTSAGGIEKKTPDDDNESDLTLLNAYCARFNVAKNGASLTTAQKAALDATVVTNFDIAAWINYIAATRISSECDDVWANLSGYIDQYDAFYNPKGDNMLHPLAYDMNLSWGQHFRDGGMGQTGLKADKDWFKSHPFYGGFVIRAHSAEGGSVVGNANYAYETIFQNPRNRELLVRRLRTLTDRYLGAPGTPKEETPVWQRLQYYRDLIADDAATDRAKWPIDGTANVINNWPSFPADLDAGLEDLWENYIVPRRVHLYVTHSATNTAKAVGYGADLNAGIPLAQASAAALRDSVAIVNLGNDGLFHDEEVLVLTNKSAVAVDISDWQLKYSVTLKLPGGTVIPAGGCVYVPADRRTFVEKLVAEGRVSDQIVTPSAVFDVTGAIALVADDGTEIVKAVPPTNESEYLRLHSFCGNTADGADGDTGEWFVLTNLSDTVELDLAGVTVCFLKEGDPEEGTAHCHVTFGKGTIAAGASLRCDQADYAGKGWVKIQNNKLGINLSDSYGSPAQTLAVAQKDYPAAYGGGGWLVADSTAKTVGKKEWHAETAVIPVQPGEAPEMKAKTAEEAQAEIAKYEVRLTDEDKASGVKPEMLMMVPAAVSNETTGVVTYHAQVAVNPEVVAPPEVGEDEAGTIKPIEIASDASGEVTVSVGINNATPGLWYGYEVSESLGTQAFANDVPSFGRATGEAVKITGSKRSGNAAFFRVKVLPAKPQK